MAFTDGCGVGVHAVDQIAPGLVHLAQELLVTVLGLQIGAGADVVGARDAEHVEEIGREHVEAQAGQPVGVDLVVGGDPVGVVHHQDAGPLAGALGMCDVARDAVLLLRDHAADDVHVSSLIEAGFSGGEPPAAPWYERRNQRVTPRSVKPVNVGDLTPAWPSRRRSASAEHDLADLRVGRHVALGLEGLGQRKDAVDDRA
jgi:hypothetical protein